MEVHRELGHGFLELVYRTALGTEFQTRVIAYAAEVSLSVKYKGQSLMCSYRADFVCFENIVVEIKAIAKLTGADDAQLINELKATISSRDSIEFRNVEFGISAPGFRPLINL